MLRKLNRKMKASVKLLSGKGGFSLPELIIAVVILAVVSGAILYSFVSASNATIKATRLSEASDAAQNIQETLEAIGVTSFQSGNEDLLKYLNITEDDFEYDEDAQTATILNLVSGGNTYDAKVNFSTGYAETVDDANGNPVIDLSTADGFWKINNKDISHYDARAVVFQQNLAYTDYKADSEFEIHVKAFNSTAEITGKSREIQLVMECEKDAAGKPETVLFKCYYQYTYEYSVMKKNPKRPNDPAIREYGKIFKPSPFYQTIADARLEDFGGSVPLYFRYFPYYADEWVRENNGFYYDKFRVENYDDLPVTVFLVKQIPEVTQADGTVVPMDNTLLDTCEMKYNVTIDEFHSDTYVRKFDLETAYKTILTNAGKDLADDRKAIGSIRYTCKGKNLEFNSPDVQQMCGEIIADGKLVNKSKFDRIYDVTIDIYKSGESDSENPAYTLNFHGNYVR